MANRDLTLDRLFTALRDPTRRAVLSRLGRGPASASELAAAHDTALPSFLAHLGKLEAAGLIRSSKQGQARTCALAPEAFAPIQDWLGAQRHLRETRLDQLDSYVTDLMKEKPHEP